MKEIAQSEYVFPGMRNNSPLSNMAFLQLLKRMDRGDLTAHGFRSTFRDWASERGNYPHHWHTGFPQATHRECTHQAIALPATATA